MHRTAHLAHVPERNIMSTNEPLDRRAGHDEQAGDTRDLGALRVSTGTQAAYITIDMILYALVVLGIFVTSAIVDENGRGPGFSAAQAWYYVTLLTVGFFVSRGLARISARRDDRTI